MVNNSIFNTPDLHVFVTYDNVIQLTDYDILENILNNYDNINNKKHLRLYRYLIQSKLNKVSFLLNRKDKNLYEMFDMKPLEKIDYYEPILSEFSLRLRTMLAQNVIDKLTICMDINNINKLTILSKLIEEFDDKVIVTELNKENLDKGVQNNNLIITDEDDMIDRELIKGKILMMPYLGYHFDKVENNMMGQEAIISKNKWEEFGEQTSTTISFAELYDLKNIKEDIYKG